MMPEFNRGTAAGAPVSRHLARGAIGFGLIGSGFVLPMSHGGAALMLVVPGMVALRGCPACWLAGLIQIVSRSRLKRSCNDGACTLTPADARSPRFRRS
jgi:hypothetical protein